MYLLFLREWKILSCLFLPPVSSSQPLDHAAEQDLLSLLLSVILKTWTCLMLHSVLSASSKGFPHFLFFPHLFSVTHDAILYCCVATNLASFMTSLCPSVSWLLIQDFVQRKMVLNNSICRGWQAAKDYICHLRTNPADKDNSPFCVK